MFSKGVKVKQSGSDEDIISSLPRDLIACILGKVSVREAVRTSVLAKKWRFYYLYIPRIVFDNEFCEELDDSFEKKGFYIHELQCNQFDEIITKFLLLHPGELEKFKVCIPYDASTMVPYVDKWILYLSWRNIKKLTLTYNTLSTQSHKLPPYFFSCLELTSLKLKNFVLTPPLEFKGFLSLYKLILVGVDFTNNCFESFISSCPLLRRLVLRGCSGVHHYNISGSYLERLFIKADDNFQSISLEKAPNLSDVYLSPGKIVEGQEGNCVSDLVTFMGCLPKVKLLGFDSQFLQVSAKKFLFQSSTELNLEQVSSDLKLLDCTTPPLSKLHQVKLTNISGFDPELEFIRFLLFSSPSLVKMTILEHPQLESAAALEPNGFDVGMKLDQETLSRCNDNFEEDLSVEDDIEEQELSDTPTSTGEVMKLSKDGEELFPLSKFTRVKDFFEHPEGKIDHLIGDGSGNMKE
ncbi:hypothetical protein CQW23_35291 [Capsicum baccatum]|uniref:F-box domain-containing protein n=1 Tax=Capsicum baccatum TaxID=33114 RepID=A0A2G2UWC1_CAPBA|nr:hypothetical protein CQW23_35291 [Capsicum baccatum]